MSSKKFSDAEITKILNAEYESLEAAWPRERAIIQQLEAVKVMRVEHARKLAEAAGRKDLLDGMAADITWADLKLAAANENPYLNAIDPGLFCQQLLDARNPAQKPKKISVDNVLKELSGGDE